MAPDGALWFAEEAGLIGRLAAAAGFRHTDVVIPSSGPDRRDACVLIGDRDCGDDRFSEQSRSCGEKAVVTLASPGATTAEVAAVQVPRLRDLAPAQVVLQLGSQDLVDGYDESYFHARVVELCDAIQRAAPRAAIEVVAVPPAAAPPRLDQLRRRCNAAAQVTADLRGIRWRGDPPAERR